MAGPVRRGAVLSGGVGSGTDCEARQARRVLVEPGPMWRGLSWQAWQGGSCCGQTRTGEAGQAWRGEERRVVEGPIAEWRCESWNGRRGTERIGEARSGDAGNGLVWQAR